MAALAAPDDAGSLRERTRRLAAVGLDYPVVLAWMAVLGVVLSVVFPDPRATVRHPGSHPGMNVARVAAVPCIVMAFATGRGPHDAAAGTQVRLWTVPSA
ncbi:hypothetical protein ACIPVK_06585 [Paeniglutamicibacter sp. MACA_103]|uniref:hypothetical protein n=1 Tax=Paeniglutamicibacter sp. MACA_103 TaxID=3377337 RepID=UPI0038932085